MPDFSPPEVHQLSTNDIARFRKLLTVLGAAFEDLDTYTRFQPDDAYLESVAAERSFHLPGCHA